MNYIQTVITCQRFFFIHLHFKLGVAYRCAVRRSVRGCRYARAEIPARACTKGRMLQHTPLSPPAANACGHPHHPLLREAIYSDLLRAYAGLFTPPFAFLLKQKTHSFNAILCKRILFSCFFSHFVIRALYRSIYSRR